MKKQNKYWENRIRQILANVREEDKARKVINLIRQLLSQKEKEVKEKAYAEGYRDAMASAENLHYDEAWSLGRQAYLDGLREGRRR